MRDSGDVARSHFEQYLKSFDVFETRQTWTFNFAILVYGVAITAGGSLLERVMSTPAVRNPVGSQEVDMGIGAMSLIFSIALPLVLLPLCYLFVDVSIYCAALSAGQRAFKEQNGMVATDPAVCAHEWLKNKRINLHWVANLRVMLFLWGPSFGVLVALLGLCYAICCSRVWLLAMLVPVLLISIVYLEETIRAYFLNRRARQAAYNDMEEAMSRARLTKKLSRGAQP